MPIPPGLSPKDSNQVLRAVMDDDTNRLRVDAIISPDGHDLEIHHEDDSIAIGTPTELFTATDVGPKVGLDVNLIGTDSPVPVSQSGTWAVEVTDGTNIIHPNTDGSVKTVQVFTLPYDAITVTYPSATQEVYVSRVGGIAGTVQETVTVNYTDATKAALLNVART